MLKFTFQVIKLYKIDITTLGQPPSFYLKDLESDPALSLSDIGSLVCHFT